jgi:hypothetical protein
LVDRLILFVGPVDSVQALLPNSAGRYLYAPVGQHRNVGSVRNRGWSATSSTTLGRLGFAGTYSVSTSRIRTITEPAMGVAAIGLLQPGESMQGMPEHTWMGRLQYSTKRSSGELSLTGAGPRGVSSGLSVIGTDVTSARLLIDSPRARTAVVRMSLPGYVSARAAATHRVTSQLEAILTIDNLTNTYPPAYNFQYQLQGRVTSLGFRTSF